MTGALLLSAMLLLAVPAQAHVVVARGSLRQYLQHSPLALHVVFETGPQLQEAPDGSDRQEFFRVRILERLSGAVPDQTTLEFFPHAEAFPGFVAGDRALLFLERTGDRPEFARHAARFPWFSVQGRGEEWRTPGGPTLALARAWLAWLAAGGDDVDALADLLASELGSGHGPLQADAILELVRARALPGLLDRPEPVARFAAFLDDGSLPIGRRAALLQLLVGRPGFDAEDAFRRLAASAPGAAERIVLARIFAASELGGVAPWLAAQALDPDPAVRRVAVGAQARRARAADLDLLERASSDPDPGVARAAIRALGALDGEAARAVLSAVAAGADPERAGWAAAELRRAGLGPVR